MSRFIPKIATRKQKENECFKPEIEIATLPRYRPNLNANVMNIKWKRFPHEPQPQGLTNQAMFGYQQQRMLGGMRPAPVGGMIPFIVPAPSFESLVNASM